jgi:hypothetical protein
MLRSTKCPHCKKKLPDGYRIHPECVEGWYAAQSAKQKAAKAKADAKRRKMDRATDRARRRALETVGELKAEAQKWFNKFIRLRDRHLPCVSCGEMNPPMKPGGQWDAGHFLSRGAYPELAFHEDNCWKQCKSCNAGGGKFKHKERTVNERYEQELIRRIGRERYELLKGPQEVKPLEKDWLRDLANTYKRKSKELEKQE